MNKFQAILSALLIGVMVFLAGCQPISGVDLNKVLTNGLTVVSSEGSQSLSLQLARDPSAKLPEDQAKLLDLFSNVKLEVTDMKTQDTKNASFKGVLHYGSGSIPFAMVLKDTDYIIEVEGLPQPIVFNTMFDQTAFADGFAEGYGSGFDPELAGKLQDELEKLSERAIELLPSMGGFIVSHAPNPSRISVADVTETIHGESLPLKKISAEIDASELAGFVKQFLTNVVADEQGLKQFIGDLYDLYIPLIKTLMMSDESMLDDPALDQILPFLENKALAVEFLHTMLVTYLETALEDYDEEALARDETTKLFFNDKQKLAIEMYVDSELNTRKQTMELNLQLSNSQESGISGVKITSTAEVWNINKPVTVDTIDLSGGFIDSKALEELNATKFVNMLDADSQLYRLLKEELNITRKQVYLFVDETDPTSPYIEQGTMMVPVRFVSEQLDADVLWDGQKQQVKITDPLDGTVIVLTIGSTQATVNGTAKSLSKAAVMKSGTTFIPVRFVSENMGAKVNYDADLELVTITRE